MKSPMQLTTVSDRLASGVVTNLATILCLATASPGAVGSDTRPNIVVIMVDDI